MTNHAALFYGRVLIGKVIPAAFSFNVQNHSYFTQDHPHCIAYKITLFLQKRYKCKKFHQ